MKKIALVVANNLWSSPYVTIYSKLLDEWGIPYDIISWNREGRDEDCIQYNYTEKSRNPISIFWAYIKFSGFVKRTISKNNYKRLIVFDSQLGIFLASYLKKWFKGEYLFDYRDLSIEQKLLFKSSFKKLIKNSRLSVISSPGFKKYIPESDYTICHNFDIKKAEKALHDVQLSQNCGTIKILTIGSIRKDMNLEVIDALGNSDKYRLDFIGKGPYSEDLIEYVREKGYKNIFFSGYYNKEEEGEIIRDCSFINIVYPLIPSHISALSNRFYNSMIYRRPMIVTRDTIQGEYAEKYKVGVVVDDCSHLDNDINAFLLSFDGDTYNKNCKSLLKDFINENKLFEDKLKQFVRFD